MAAPAAEPSVQDAPVTHIRPSQGWRALNLRELWDYRELVYFLTWRDIKVRYKQTILGALWAILQPLFTMVVFSIFFGALAGVPSDGIPYPLFSFAALVPWTFFASGLTMSTNSMVSSAGLIRKVYFPRLAIPIGSVGGGLLDFLLAFLVLLGMICGYMAVNTPLLQAQDIRNPRQLLEKIKEKRDPIVLSPAEQNLSTFDVQGRMGKENAFYAYLNNKMKFDPLSISSLSEKELKELAAEKLNPFILHDDLLKEMKKTGELSSIAQDAKLLLEKDRETVNRRVLDAVFPDEIVPHYEVSITANIKWLPLFLLLALMTSLGAGMWLSAMNVQFRDVRFAVPFLIQAWLFATPIAYPSSLLSGYWRALYALNPMVGVVEGFRWALLGLQQPPILLILVSSLASCALFVSGAYYFRRMEKTFADVV